MWRCTFSRLGSAGSNKGKTTASILTGTVALWKPKTGVGHLRVDGVEQDYTFFGSDMSPELRAAVKEKTEFEFEVDNSAGHKPKAIKLRPLSNVNYKKAAKTLVAKQGTSSQNENASSPASASAKNEKGTDDSSTSEAATDDNIGTKRMKEPPRRLTGTVKRIAGLGGFISVPGQNHDYFFHRKNLAQSVDFGNDMHIGTRVAFLGHTALNSYIATDVAPFEKSTSNTDGAKAEDAEIVSGGLSRNDQAASLLACVDQQVRVTGRLSRFFMSATGGFIHIFGLRRDAVFNLTDVEDPTLLESANDPDRKDKIKMMDRALRISFLLVSDSSARNRSGLRAVQIRRLLPDDDSIFRVESQDVQEGEQAKAAALGATTTTSGGADKPRSFVKEGYITSFDVGSGYGVISTFDRTPTVAPEERFHVFVLRNLSPDLRKLDTNHLVNQCVSFIETSTPQGKRGADDIVIAENPKSMDEIMAHRQWRKTAEAHQPLPPAESSSASTTTSATAGETTAGTATKSKLLRGTVEHYDTATRQGTIRWVDEEKNRNETLRFVNANAENEFNQGQSVVFRRVLGSAGSGDAAIQVQPFRHHGVVIGYNRMSQLSTKFHGFILPIETYRQLKDDAFFLTNPLDHGAIYFSSDYIQNTTQVKVVLGAHVLYEAHSQGEAKNYAATVFPRLRVEKAENLKPTGQRGADTVVKVPASLQDDCEAYLEGSDQDYVVKETTQCLERLRKASMMLTVARARKTLAQRRLRAADASEVADTAAAKGSSSAMTKPGGESFEKKTFRLRGTVSGFDRNKHYGFIEREGEPADHYFFRFDSAVVSRMHIGLPVEFYETDHSRPNHRRAYDIDFLFEESSNNNKAKASKANTTTTENHKLTSAAA